MRTKLLLISASLFGFVSMSTAALPADTPAKVAEYIYSTNALSRTCKEFVKASRMSPKHSREALSYLTGHGLENAATPVMHWKHGTSKVRIEAGNEAFDMDFAKLPSGPLLVNGKPVEIAKNASFEEVVRRIEKALSGRAQSASRWILPAAYAEGSIVASVVGAADYFTGLDQLFACIGQETLTKSRCIFSSNSSMILADTQNGITEFSCNGDKFTSLRYNHEIGHAFVNHLGLDAKYNSSGHLEKLTTLLEGHPTCGYAIKNGKLANSESGDVYCEGRAAGAFSDGMRKGDKPSILATEAVPLERLQSCCKSSQCKNEIAKAIARTASPSIVPASDVRSTK